MNQPYQTTAVSQSFKNLNALYQAKTKRGFSADANLNAKVNTGSEQRSKRKKYAFPTPGNVSSKERAFLCDADRVLALYNKCHGVVQKRVTSPVRSWFEREARQAGWAQVTHLANIQASRSAGYMLLAPSCSEVRNAIGH